MVEERRGCAVRNSSMVEFDNFIDRAGLVNIPLVGRLYTCAGNVASLGFNLQELFFGQV